MIEPVTRFHDLVEMVIADEGGFVVHPKDPGGATNMGITLDTLSRWRGERQTAADVEALTRLEAKQIYLAFYWNTVRGDLLPVGVDYVVFDFGVNAGPPRAARFLQEVVGAEQDGAIGPKTLAATKLIAPVGIIRAFHDVKMEFYRKAKNRKTGALLWPTFGRGWTRRANGVRQNAYGMVGYRPQIGDE